MVIVLALIKKRFDIPPQIIYLYSHRKFVDSSENTLHNNVIQKAVLFVTLHITLGNLLKSIVELT